MKLIVGFLTAKPGKREAFLAAARHHLEETRKEPDCHYFEMLTSPDDPDRIVIAEAFASEAAHRAHEDTDHMRALWAVMPDLLQRAEFDSIAADAVRHDEEVFGGEKLTRYR